MPTTDPRQTLGRRGEQLAAEHLERLGFSIVVRNHRTRHGEIDIVAYDGHTLVFCEVKKGSRTTRTSVLDKVGGPTRISPADVMPCG